MSVSSFQLLVECWELMCTQICICWKRFPQSKKATKRSKFHPTKGAIKRELEWFCVVIFVEYCFMLRQRSYLYLIVFIYFPSRLSNSANFICLVSNYEFSVRYLQRSNSIVENSRQSASSTMCAFFRMIKWLATFIVNCFFVLLRSFLSFNPLFEELEPTIFPILPSYYVYWIWKMDAGCRCMLSNRF